jgi:hypothetical protein
VNFEALSGEAIQRLQAMAERYASGPAALPPSIAKQHAIDDAQPSTAHGASRPDRARSREASGDDSRPDPTPEQGNATTREARGVRGERRHYSRRVIALGDEIARVLIGRDLSAGGMRVDPHPGLSVGDTLQIAVYARTGERPVVVSAEVTRDDGDKGLALQFRDLSLAARHSLGRMVESLPYLEVRQGNEEGAGRVVSAILDRESR